LKCSLIVHVAAGCCQDRQRLRKLRSERLQIYFTQGSIRLLLLLVLAQWPLHSFGTSIDPLSQRRDIQWLAAALRYWHCPYPFSLIASNGSGLWLSSLSQADRMAESGHLRTKMRCLCRASAVVPASQHRTRHRHSNERLCDNAASERWA